MDLIKRIPESDLIDYIKSRYAKIIFNPLKLKSDYKSTNSLGFIISDNKLVVGYINKDGNLCKLIEPIDLLDLSNDKFTEIIKKIPVVNEFSKENRDTLVKLLENTNSISKVENDIIILQLKKQLSEDIVKYDVLFNISNEKDKSNMDNIILIKKEYSNIIEEIKVDYNHRIEQLEEKIRISEEIKNECTNRMINEKEVIISGIKNFQRQVKDYIVELINKNNINTENGKYKLNDMYTKLLNEKLEIESNMSILIEREKGYLSEINKNKSELSQFTQLINEKENTINELMETIKEIQTQLDYTKEQFSREELEKTILKDYKDKCVNKILYEKQEIIDNIKEYTDNWIKWADNNKINIDQQKEKLKTELDVIYHNLKKVFKEKNNYFKNLEISSREKDKLIAKLNSNISEIKDTIEISLNQQLSQLSAKNEELQSKLINTEHEIEIRDNDIVKLKLELEHIKKLLDKNNSTVILKDIDYNNCYSILQKFMSINNMFYRKKEIMVILDNLINSTSINNFTNLNEDIRTNITKKYSIVKDEINRHIEFLDLNRYTNSPNVILFKNKNTVKNVPQSFCDELNIISEYWNSNVLLFREQDNQLTNIYEDLSGAVRVYINIKPLIGIEQKNNTVYIEGDQKKLTVDCSKVTNVNKKETYGDFYGVFNETFNNRDIYTGIEKSGNLSDIKVNIDDIVEKTESVHPGLFNSFKQVEDGYSIVLFGYGNSGSGKTYTLLGQDSSPGLLHFGLFNLKNVHQIKLKYLFEQYIGKGKVGFNPAFHKITGNIINLINEIPQMRKYSINETDEFVTNFPISIDINNIKVNDISIIISYIEKYRIKKSRIKKTPNNPVSSRSHLYMVYEITFNTGKVGYITIIDTAGRESPIDIYKMFIDNSSRNASLTSIFSLDTGRQLVGTYINKKYEDYSPDNVYNILREGFYINETINHLIYFFNKKNYKKTVVKIQTNLDNYSNDRYYINPQQEEKSIDGLNNCLMIPILNFLDSLSNKKNHNDDFKLTKFITLVCVRKDEIYCNQIFSSLEFADRIK